VALRVAAATPARRCRHKPTTVAPTTEASNRTENHSKMVPRQHTTVMAAMLPVVVERVATAARETLSPPITTTVLFGRGGTRCGVLGGVCPEYRPASFGSVCPGPGPDQRGDPKSRNTIGGVVSRLGRTALASGGLGTPGSTGMGITDPPRSTALRMAPPPPPAITTQKEIVVSLPAGSSF